jgi:hypothetical protein
MHFLSHPVLLRLAMRQSNTIYDDGFGSGEDDLAVITFYVFIFILAVFVSIYSKEKFSIIDWIDQLPY